MMLAWMNSDSGGSDGSSATSAATSTGADATTGDGSGATDMSTGSGGATGTTAGPTTAGSSTEDPFKFDVGDDSALAGDTDDPPAPSCKVVDDMDAIGSCDAEAPPDSFEPDVQWAWPGAEGETQVVGTPVVANLTDDNQDGEIDLCDTPDVVVLAYPQTSAPGYLYILDGETGVPITRGVSQCCVMTTSPGTSGKPAMRNSTAVMASTK